MQRVVTFVLLLACLAGCSASEDAQRLAQIDAKFQNRDFSGTKRDALKYVQEYPDSSRGWSILGWAYLKSEDLEKAQECFDKSIGIDPKWDNAHVGKGAVYRKSGDNGNARQCYLAAIEILPENAEAFASLLVVELIEGNDAQAVEYGEKAWRLDSRIPVVAANLSVAYHYAGDHEKRDEFFQHAERLSYHGLDALQEIYAGQTSVR